MKLSLKISLISGGLNGFISAILGLSKEVEDDGGVDKDGEYSFDFYTKFSGLDSSSVSTTTNFGDPLTSISIIVTDVIFGNFTSVTCESGKIIAYIK